MRLEGSMTVESVSRTDRKEVTVTLEVGDYTTPDGYAHRDGVYRVKATNADGTPYKGRSYKGRAKTFKGETAWMRGESLFNDIVAEVRFSR